MVAAEPPLPPLLTVADRVNGAPVAGLPSVTEGCATVRSGRGGCGTVTVTAAEQLLVVSVSSDTAPAHAP